MNELLKARKAKAEYLHRIKTNYLREISLENYLDQLAFYRSRADQYYPAARRKTKWVPLPKRPMRLSYVPIVSARLKSALQSATDTPHLAETAARLWGAIASGHAAKIGDYWDYRIVTGKQ